MPPPGLDEADGRFDPRVVPAVARGARGVRFWRLRDEVVIGYGTEPPTILSAIVRRGSVRLGARASAGLENPQVKSFSGMQIYHTGGGRSRARSKDLCKSPADGYH